MGGYSGIRNAFQGKMKKYMDERLPLWYRYGFYVNSHNSDALWPTHYLWTPKCVVGPTHTHTHSSSEESNAAT